MKFLRAVGRSIPDFVRDECFYLAASISYFLIVSLVPLSLLIISLFGFMLGQNQELYEFVLSRLVSFFPSVTSGITNELGNIITYKGISLITLLIYVFLSLQIFYSIEHSMNIIFKVPRRRHFLLSLFWSVFMMTLLIIFLLLSFTLSSMAVFFVGNEASLLGVEFGSLAGILIGYIAPFLLVLSTFTAVYLIIPKVKISFGVALSGSFIVTILWELAKHFFTWYVKNVIQFGTIYGSLTTFILFLLWVYYLSCIFLFGGEFVSNMNRRV